MGNYLWIAAGSAVGGVGRYWCSGLIARHVGETFPWGTLFVNALGSVLIGLVAALAAPEGRLLISSTTRQFLMMGIFGGFTTFSSFSLEVLNMAHDGELGPAAVYVLASLLLCFAGVWGGFMLGALINR